MGLNTSVRNREEFVSAGIGSQRGRAKDKLF